MEMKKMDEQNIVPQPPAADTHPKGMRRRGEVLEDAILHAALTELSENGFEKLTMENVADRAETNKAVLYRRWPNKSELVIAALRKFAPPLPREVPDSGDLRTDLYTYLRKLMSTFRIIGGAATIRGLMSTQFSATMLASLASIPQVIRSRPEDKLVADVAKILKNAEARGEVKMERLSPRIISLPLDLLRYELISRQEPVSDEVVAEIVDEIFLPLVRMRSDFPE